jgi:adenylylsulfate reductase subunit A
LGELKAVRDPEVEEREVDVLIVGGGMAACGTAFEVKKWLATARAFCCATRPPWKDPARLPRVFPPSTPTSAKTPDDYVRMVRNDLMGIVREDLIFDLGCHVDDSVHLFEEWGLPVWKKTEDGKNLDGKKGQKMGTLKAGASRSVPVNGRS